jgi:hypothetical protein
VSHRVAHESSKVCQAHKKASIFVERTGHLLALDPRDKIFGLLGLAKNEISPDYNISIGDLYLDFAKKWVKNKETQASSYR